MNTSDVGEDEILNYVENSSQNYLGVKFDDLMNE